MSPQDYMSLLDSGGASYWIEDLCLAKGQDQTSTPYVEDKEPRRRWPERFDVLSHGNGWLQLREDGTDNPPLFVNMANVVSMRIVEG